MYDLTFCRCPTANHCYPCQGDSLVHSKGYDCTCSCHVYFHLGVQLTPPLFGYGTSFWGVFLHFHTCIYPVYQLDVGHSNFESASGVCAHGYVMVEKFTPCLSMPECRNPTLVKCGGEAQHLEKVRIGSPPGLPTVQSSTKRPKTPRIGMFLVSLERS
jgi:hypothetical protein